MGFVLRKYYLSVFYKSMPDFKITKVEAGAPVAAARKTRRRSMRTFPKGVLKGGVVPIVGVKDPTAPPPLRKNAKGTLRILTPSGMRKRHETIKTRIRTMADKDVREVLRKNKMGVSDKTPIEIARNILQSGTEAGMIVIK
jgi:hypothetical protein